MNAWMILRLALRALVKNKVRTALTMLGILIGIASVIAMVALGQGASRMVEDQINAMGRNIVMVLPGAASSGGFSWGSGSIQTLTPDDAAAIAKEVPTVAATAPVVRVRGVRQVVAGSQNWVPDNAMGTNTDFPQVRDWPLDEGTFFSEQDVRYATKVCVIGATISQNLFQGASPLGQTVRIKNMPFKVVGLLTRKGTNAIGQDQDDTLLVPWTTAKRVLEGSTFNNVSQILLSVDTAGHIPAAMAEVTALLHQRHRIRPGEADDFRLMSMTEMASATAETSKVMSILLLVTACISLLVGGIGIMNIMLVSVVERTREIGVRMAMGARGRDILAQFLAESVALSLAAGVLGMLLGASASWGIQHFLQWPTQLSLGAVAVSLLFSCGIGVFFGMYPAVRASRLDPIEALRHE